MDLTECTICSYCAREIFDFFQKSGKPIAPYAKYVLDFTVNNGIDEEVIYCDVCCDEVEEDYHRLNISYTLLTSIADNLSQDIGGCERCHGNERRWFEHSYNNDPYEGSPIDLGGSHDNVGGYLRDSGVPDVLVPVFVKLIKCKCGYGRHARDGNNPDAGIFDEQDDVYTNQEVESMLGFEVEAFSEFAEKYEEIISEKDLLKFRDVLRTQPMLAFKNKTGAAIYNVLKKHYDAGEYDILKASEVKLFRGRTRAVDSSKAYTVEELWTAPLGKPSHGRYNSIGVPVLYVTNQERAIPYEINPSHDQLIDIITFDILKKKLKLFNIGSFDSNFEGFFSEVNEDTNIVKTAYLLPNYIGACCNEIGYDGVMYKGVQSFDQLNEYTNYALFNMELNLDLKASSKEVNTFRPKFTIDLQLEEKEEPLQPENFF
ncbi:hypothetical protein SAMN04488603_1162 [Paenibacillus sp. cl130]|nr:hypothetical protein SAMN04488603_1162 [Paenibacillus sp. cl130]